MNRLFAIALNTFREAMRNKVLYTILFFACALILSSWAIGQLSLHEEVRVARDLGLGGISLFGVVLAVFVGVNLVYKEIERKTVFALVPKPIHRWQFIVGKYLGMALTLAVQVGLMAAVLAVTLLVEGARFDGAMLRAVLLLYVQVLVVTGIAVLFSSFSTPFLSGLFTVGLFAIGRSTPDLRAFLVGKVRDAGTLKVLEGALELLPDLHMFSVSGSMLDGQAVSVNGARFVDWTYVATATGYGFAYTACVLAIAIVVFSRRDFV